jgi:hypothetical protein
MDSIYNDLDGVLSLTAPADDEYESADRAQTAHLVSGGGVARACGCLGGSRILTARGEVAVERLQIGEGVVTASGELRPIVGIDHRRFAAARLAGPDEVRPVRIAAHAFGHDLPARDLYLAPGQAIAWEGWLVPAVDLVNGRSIVQLERRDFECWQVELASHDVILAEGLPTETCLDAGAAAPASETSLPLAETAEARAPAQAQLLAQLAARGCALSHDGDPHLIADGQRIDPIRLDEARYAFVAPEGAAELALASRIFVPAEVQPGSPDRRPLGLCVCRLQLDGIETPLDFPPAVGQGWHAPEIRDGTALRRWTSGVAKLPARARIVLVELAGEGS